MEIIKKFLNFLKVKLKKNIFYELPEIINWYKKIKFGSFITNYKL